VILSAVYFIGLFSLLYYFSVRQDFCPRSALETIRGLSAFGYVMFVTLTILWGSAIVAELLLCRTHFTMFGEYTKKYVAASPTIAKEAPPPPPPHLRLQQCLYQIYYRAQFHRRSAFVPC
jgi:hypothetical protein